MNPIMPPQGGGMPPATPPVMPPAVPPQDAPDAGGPQIPPQLALAILQKLASESPSAPPDTTGIAGPSGEVSPEALAYFLQLLGVSPEAAMPAIGASAKLSQPGVTPEDFGAYDDAMSSLPLDLGGRQLDPQLLAMLSESLPDTDPDQIPLPPSPQSYGA